jgi:hypothetical protein
VMLVWSGAVLSRPRAAMVTRRASRAHGGVTGCSVVRATRDDQTARGRAGYWRHG